MSCLVPLRTLLLLIVSLLTLRMDSLTDNMFLLGEGFHAQFGVSARLGSSLLSTLNTGYS